jgi:hypothetical protein
MDDGVLRSVMNRHGAAFGRDRDATRVSANTTYDQFDERDQPSDRLAGIHLHRTPTTTGYSNARTTSNGAKKMQYAAYRGGDDF